MFGRDILVVPRLNLENPKIWVELPTSRKWFSFKTKEEFEGKGFLNFQLHEQAIFVKYGTILPILLHRNELSIIEALENPIRLEIYGE